MARRHSRSPSPVSSSKRPRRDDREEREKDRHGLTSSRRKEHDDEKERDRRRDRDRDRDKDRVRDRERGKDKDKDKDRERERDRDRDKDKDKDKERARRRSRSRDRDRERQRREDRDRERVDERDRDKDRDRNRDRDRESHKDRDRNGHNHQNHVQSNHNSTPRSASPVRTQSRKPSLAPAPVKIVEPAPVVTKPDPALKPASPLTSSAQNEQAPLADNNKKTETPAEEKLRIKRERLEAWKASKAAGAVKAEASAVATSTISPAPIASTSKAPISSSSSLATRPGLPVSSTLPAKPTTPVPSTSTHLRSAPVGLPKKPSFNAFGKSTTKGPTRATAVGMMGDDEEETKTLYKPEEGLEIEGGLEPDQPTAEQLEEIRKQDEAMVATNASKEEKDDDDAGTGAEQAMNVDEQSATKNTMIVENEADGDTEMADGGPAVKAAPLSRAQREAEQEEREAAEIEARMRARAQAQGEEEIDPLDAFMLDVEVEKKKVDTEDARKLPGGSNNDASQKGEATLTNGINGASHSIANASSEKEKKNKKSTRLIDAFADESSGEEDVPDPDDLDKASIRPEDILALAQKKLKKREIAPVDHSKITYDTFTKLFYHPPPEIEEMTNEDAEALRVELDNIKIRGVDCPKPITRWSHCGLPAVCLEVIRGLGYPKPTSIQSQAIPAIMSGRDVIGVAKTGSGKTVAFLLPMFRHIKDQRPLDTMEGPIAMIMTPTRELATQIAREAKPFLKVLGLRVTCAYGGSPLKDNIADMKRGAEVIVCTPGRMIELLVTNSGRIINLRRVTYLVLDEADRMFDMGFEPQVMKIIGQIRPDRQTVLFSATFPRQMEALARKILRKPLEITVGGRSVVAAEIEQLVEVREEETKFNRLLEILGRTYNDDSEARTLVFVHRQDSADNLLRDLLAKNYACMSLHGGKDQVDRDATISDFKAGIIPIVIATSVAARGLDVKLLKLVINYDCPNHMEDYVHRAGRTGRAGNKGTCITFITPDQDRYAVDLQKALEASAVAIPDDLKKLAETFIEKVKAGKATAASSGFGGKGLERLEQDREAKDRAQRTAYGEEEAKPAEGDDGTGATTATKKGEDGATGASGAGGPDLPDIEVEVRRGPAPDTGRKGFGVRMNDSNLAALKAAESAANKAGIDATGISKAQSVIARLTASIQAKKQQQFGHRPDADGDVDAARRRDPDATDFHAVVPINDYPQKARWKVTNKETMVTLIETTGASITNKGVYYDKGKEPGPDDPPKLHLLIESNDEMRVRLAISEIKRFLVDASTAALEQESRDPSGRQGGGRYNVLS